MRNSISPNCAKYSSSHQATTGHGNIVRNEAVARFINARLFGGAMDKCTDSQFQQLPFLLALAQID